MRREIAAIGLAILIAAAVFGAAYRGYSYPPRHALGPDWDCPPIADATVCIKRVRPAPLP